MNPNYNLVADRAAHRCEYCRAPEIVFNFPFEIEHIVPLAKILFIKFWDGLEAHPTRKKIFVGWASSPS